jgi:pimeloyl-ACP methyl ester carboxylesterase
MKKYLFIALLLLTAGVLSYLHKGPIPFEDLKSKYTDEYSNFISLNGLDVHYKKKGSGMPILLIHGTSSSLHTWEKWETELSKYYTTYSIDMQGGGLTTPPPDNDYSIAAYISLIDAFVEALAIDSFYLAGNSLGGHTAWAYAANSPNASKVKKLILVDPSGFFDKNMDKPTVFQLAQFDFLFNNIESINTAPFVAKSLKEVYYNKDLVSEEIIQRYQDLGSRAGNRQAFFHKVRQIESGKKEDLRKIDCPTLILWGENDLWIPVNLSEIFLEHIPNKQLIVYPECGHVPMEEKAAESVADVISFLSE